MLVVVVGASVVVVVGASVVVVVVEFVSFVLVVVVVGASVVVVVGGASVVVVGASVVVVVSSVVSSVHMLPPHTAIASFVPSAEEVIALHFLFAPMEVYSVQVAPLLVEVHMLPF